MTEKAKMRAVLNYAAALGVTLTPSAPSAPAAKPVKAAKPKPVLATLELATSLVGKPVSFEAGFKPRSGVLEAVISGHYDVAWKDGEKVFTFVPSDAPNAHRYLALAGEPKRFRIDKVYNLA